jgi:hypothetical protein
METTKRFPQELGNLAQNARFPHSHSQPSLEERGNKETENAKERDRSTTHCLDRHAVMAGFAVSVNGRFSDVHRGHCGQFLDDIRPAIL